MFSACPGDHIAKKIVWIEIACLLAAFNFAPPQDENGNVVNLAYATNPGSEFILLVIYHIYAQRKNNLVF